MIAAVAAIYKFNRYQWGAMKKQVEIIILTNGKGQKLRIYKVEGTTEENPVFCIGHENDDHFEFSLSDSSEIITAINDIVDCYIQE
jgi:hypothetical protein